MKIYLRKLLWKFICHPARETTLKTRNGILTVNTRDRVLAKELFSARHYEWNTIVTVIDTLKRHSLYKSSCMIDVGANIGMISIACVRSGFFERAIAIEPEPYNFQLLQKNIRQNHLESKIECHNVALSSQNGTLDLEIAKDNFGDHRLRPVPAAAPGFYHEEKRNTQSVKVARLDDLLSDPSILDSIGLIWVDTQGHEGHLFEGAKSVIKRKIPVVCEFWPYALNRAGTSKEQYIALAQELFAGYFHINSEKPEWASLDTLHLLFDEYRRPREMGTVLFV
jgi:FkbM family methyltransferase